MLVLQKGLILPVPMYGGSYFFIQPKLLKFTLDDGERKDRVILSGIHDYYEPEELVGKTAIAIVNLPPRKMM